MKISMQAVLDAIKAIDVDKVTATRGGYSQHFKEKGRRLTHYLVRNSDGTKSNEANYEQIAKLDGYVSVSEFYGQKAAIMTAQEFVNQIAN